MKQSEYILAKNRLVDEHTRLNISGDDKLNRSLNFVSANLANFVPAMAASAHEDLFKQILLHQRLSWLDIQYPDIFDHVSSPDGIDSIINLLKTQPSVICTFHLGSIRLINYLLGRNGIKYALVISDTAVNEHEQRYQQIFEQHQHYYSAGEKFNIISAQSGAAGIQMLRELKNGRSLLIYIDGNTGVNNKSIEQETLIKINFLAESIYARKGVAYFSHAAQVPIVVAANCRTATDNIEFAFSEPIYPSPGISRAEYITTATQKIYAILAALISQYPGQWESWLNLHSIIRPAEFNPLLPEIANVEDGKCNLQFNIRRFGLFNIGKELYLFNKRKYTSIPLNPVLFNLLQKSILSPVDPGIFEANILNQLISNNVLI